MAEENIYVGTFGSKINAFHTSKNSIRDKLCGN